MVFVRPTWIESGTETSVIATSCVFTTMSRLVWSVRPSGVTIVSVTWYVPSAAYRCDATQQPTIVAVAPSPKSHVSDRTPRPTGSYVWSKNDTASNTDATG